VVVGHLVLEPPEKAKQHTNSAKNVSIPSSVTPTRSGWFFFHTVQGRTISSQASAQQQAWLLEGKFPRNKALAKPFLLEEILHQSIGKSEQGKLQMDQAKIELTSSAFRVGVVIIFHHIP